MKKAKEKHTHEKAYHSEPVMLDSLYARYCQWDEETQFLVQYNMRRSFEPRHQRTGFLHMRKQRRRSAVRVSAQLISAFVFATQIVHFLCYLNPKFQVSIHLLWLYRPVCVGPGRKPRTPVFSQQGSFQRTFNLFSVRLVVWDNRGLLFE